MEWLGILLLYIISGFIKKRQQDQKRREIESEPDWDGRDIKIENEPSNNLEQLFNDLFEQNPKISNSYADTKEIIDSEVNHFQSDDQDLDTSALLEESDISSEKDFLTIDNQREKFEEKIYHSNLSERKELYLGNKWLVKKSLSKELFKSNQSLRKSIIIKEIIDKPLSMRS